MEITNTDELELIEKYRDGYRGVYYHARDFETLARVYEQEAGFEMFDRTKFTEALEDMCRKHDFNIGITWDTLKLYLYTYCKLPKGSPRQLKVKL